MDILYLQPLVTPVNGLLSRLPQRKGHFGLFPCLDVALNRSSDWLEPHHLVIPGPEVDPQAIVAQYGILHSEISSA